MGRQVPIRAGVGASGPTKGNFSRQSCLLLLQAGGFPLAPCTPTGRVGETTQRLSPRQTIGAVRTAVRSACCLPELRVANRLRRLYPLDDGELFKFNLKSSVCQRQTGLPKGNPPCVFPSFPFGNLRAPKVARKPMDGNPAVRTEVGAPDPCKGPLRSIVFPGPISPMESLPPFLDIPLFGAPTPRCRIAFFSFFSFAAESKRSPPSFRLNPAPFWYVFSVGNPRLRKRSGTTFRSGFSLFFS